MKIKDILCKAYNALEFVVVIATMIYIVAMRFGDVTHDRIEYLDRWEYAIIGLAWLFSSVCPSSLSISFRLSVPSLCATPGKRP